MRKKIGLLGLIIGLLAVGLFIFFRLGSSESALVNKFQEKYNEIVLAVFYDDFDGNGTPEAFILTGNKDEQGNWLNGKVWFVNKDQVTLVKDNFSSFPFIEAQIIEINKVKILGLETSAASDGLPSTYWYGVGGNKPVKMFECENGQFTQENGQLSQENGQFILRYNAHDHYSDNRGNSWKDYYFYCIEVDEPRKIKLQEYGAIPITLEQFLAFEGAQEVLFKLKSLGENMIITHILYRENKIININYILMNENGNGYEQDYVTVNYDDQKVSNLVWGEGGKYEAALFPGIATYPVFKNPQ
ncbi:MAG TPA: hypothetical protein PLJ33_03120 [Peptococcaceae bacterium]|jgi:hypothetical protein|nr:hypothetical protein [Peptococcaceae bacterium]HQD53834.1 hypothetical protein [Peptococcaceae bacterium]